MNEFESQLATLCAGYNVPCTAERLEAYGKAFGNLHPAQWARLIEHCLSEAGPDRMPTVRDLWGMRRDLRAGPPTYVHEQRQLLEEFDAWAIEANRHLFAYLLRHVYQPGGSQHPMARQPMIFVRYKNAWAQDMREAATAEGVPIDVQKAAWRDCMERAEQDARAQLQ